MSHNRPNRRPSSVLHRAACEALENRNYLSVTFANPSPITVLGARSPLVTARFHGSTGNVDLAVGSATGVEILNGTGTGLFSEDGIIPFPANAASQDPFIAGNFNGNVSDIVFLSQDQNTLNGVISYESSDGAGNFIPGSTSNITNGGFGFNPISAATGYFNADGGLDLAIVGKSAAGSSLVLAIMLSNGNGTFTEAGDYPIAASNPAGNITDEPILTGDYGNGFTSIAVFDGSGQDIDIFTGAGNGTFTAAAPLSQAASIVTQGAFTSSVTNCFAVASGNQITVVLGHPNGTFTAQMPMTMPGPITALSNADYNLDGHTDLITNQGIFLGNGDGTFQTTATALPTAISGGGSFSNTLQTVDLDVDGRPDFVGFDPGGNGIITALNTSLIPSNVFVNSNTNPANPGDDVQLTISVTSSAVAVPTGTVEVFDGATDLGGGTLTQGAFFLDAGTNLNVGSHSLTAVYSGNSKFATSTSEVLAQTVLVPTTTTLISNVSTAQSGNEVIFTATVAGSDTAGDVPAGSVQFLDGLTPLATVTLTSGLIATAIVADLSPGTHSITAVYKGNNTFASSTSAAVAVTETAPPVTPVVSNTTIPVAVVTGAAVHGNVTVKLTNNTANLMNGPFTIGIFATNDGDVVGSPQVTTFSKKLKIAPSKTATVKVPIKLFPTTLADGTYFLFAQATDPANEVSNSISGPSVQVAAPFVALGPIAGGGALKPGVLKAGKSAVVTFSMKNYGNILSSTAQLGLGISTDGQTDAISLGNVTPTEKIKPNKTKAIHIRLTIPKDLAAGKYYIDVAVTSSGAITRLFGPAFQVVA